MLPPNSYGKVLIPSTSEECNCIWRAFKVVIKVKLGHVSGPNPIQLVSLFEGEIMTQTCEHTQRKDQVRT